MNLTIVGDDHFEWSPPYPAELLAVIGSRRRNEPADAEQVLLYIAQRVDEAEKRNERVVIVSGGASAGADRHAERIAAAAGLDLICFRPRTVPSGSPYYTFVKALFDRNTRIVETASVIAAQVHADRKGGTEDALKKAHLLGKVVDLLTPNGEVVREFAPAKSRKNHERMTVK